MNRFDIEIKIAHISMHASHQVKISKISKNIIFIKVCNDFFKTTEMLTQHPSMIEKA